MRAPYKLLFLTGFLGTILSGFAVKDSMRVIDNDSFKSGETLQYKVHYGVINAGEAVINVAPTLHRVNNRTCYQASVNGKTTGSFDFFHRVRDSWTSYIDTAAIVPQRFVRSIEEGRYRKKEYSDFDHFANKVSVTDSRDNRKNANYNVPDNVQDMVSGFYFLRTLKLHNYKPGDTFKVQGFLDDEVFNLIVTYKGKEVVETKAGKIRAHRLVPRMPANKLFSGEDAISVYLSDDNNKIPVLIQAEMFVGAVKVDLYKYSGLQSRLSVVR
ncbi:DUF3108 domain-containing protein [Nibribacter ruber]|uniref:DUF3108 domain-containing protein n=1 Tax=Nibribacter ruber TaxID=2698458 RepID=A0A6P1P326_9BACT|nr:DUF3108 domain-containing protein [Nibribacter ruber]QHL88791.1 DUF3108 domain-containing protein [Nibribacter ruber]